MNANNQFEFKYILGDAQDFLIKRASDLIDLVVQQQIDTLVFLDRSARPASWIFEAFWKKKYGEDVPPMIFICTGKKDLKNNSFEQAKDQLKYDLGSTAENLKGTRVSIVDDIEKSGEQKEFITDLLNTLYEPEEILYFEWNKLGGMRLPHGLSYEDDSSFIAKEDKSKERLVENIREEIARLAESY